MKNENQVQKEHSKKDGRGQSAKPRKEIRPFLADPGSEQATSQLLYLLGLNDDQVKRLMELTRERALAAGSFMRGCVMMELAPETLHSQLSVWLDASASVRARAVALLHIMASRIEEYSVETTARYDKRIEVGLSCLGDHVADELVTMMSGLETIESTYHPMQGKK